MSVMNECFKVCKQLHRLSFTNELRGVIHSLNSSTEDDIKNKRDRSIIGYIARQQNCQFLGYLLVNYKKEEIERQRHPIPSIELRELDLIKKAHSICHYVNTKVISRFSKYPNLLKSIDPYSLTDIPNWEINIHDVIDPNVMDELIISIIDTKPAKNILKEESQIINKIPPEQVHAIVLEFIKRIEHRGVNSSPEDFKKTNLFLAKPSREDIIQNIIYSAMALRKILFNVNQLIYQALLKDRLIILNEDNIINIVKNTSHSIGKGMTILAQPYGDDFFIQVAELILVKVDFEHYNLNSLCSVEGIHFSHSNENGGTQEISMRVVDEELNPYFSILY